MKYEQVRDLKCEQFRRLTGVKRETFTKMIEILKESDLKKKSKGGRKSKLCIEDQLLMTLEYLREYRTYFHISQSYGLCESTTYCTIKWVEETLVKHRDFALPGRKALLKSEVEYEIIMIDATETPCERPKKSKGNTTQGRKKDTL